VQYDAQNIAKLRILVHISPNYINACQTVSEKHTMIMGEYRRNKTFGYIFSPVFKDAFGVAKISVNTRQRAERKTNDDTFNKTGRYFLCGS
jgi:hypothetical protein